MTEHKKSVIVEEDIAHREWRFGMHLPTGPNGEDLHLVKEVITLKDGTKKPNMRVIPNFERPIWMTKPQHRVHTDKKEYEKLSKLDCHMVTQSKLRNKVAALTGNPTSSSHLSELLSNPFIYAGDVPSTAILNREMYQKNNTVTTPTPYKVGAFDTETSMTNDIGDIIIGSMTVLPDVHLVFRSDWLDYRGNDLDGAIKKVMQDKLGPEIEEHKLNITYEVVDTEIDIVIKSFQWFHEKMPDWMAIWNIDFDVTKILDACKRADVDPLQILSDPRVPYDYRIAKYKRAQTNKVAASGKAKPVPSKDQWNVMFLTSSFFMVDAMSAYRLLRLGEQEERSYALDAILDKESKGKIRKLTHPPADKYVKGKWHTVMQTEHKFVYLAYAAMDTISMCLLDRITRDLSHRLPTMADITDFSQCNSQPKRLRDAFYVFAKEEHNAIIGSVGFSREVKPPEPEVDLGDILEDGFEEDEDDEDYQVLDRKNWVNKVFHRNKFSL